MSFDVDLITDITKLVQHNLPTGRVYTAEDGSIPDEGYPSVTTVLSADKSKKGSIDAWRKRVGDVEADKVMHRASSTGTAVHLVMEDFILDQKPQTKPMPYVYEIANRLKKEIDGKIGKVRMVEGQLFSHYLRAAGTADLIAEFDGKLSIIDWKTSKWNKKSESISSYYMQLAAYAVMFEERTGIPVPQLVIVMSGTNPDSPFSKVFVEKRDDWIGKFIEVREMYDTQLQSMLQGEGTDTVASNP